MANCSKLILDFIKDAVLVFNIIKRRVFMTKIKLFCLPVVFLTISSAFTFAEFYDFGSQTTFESSVVMIRSVHQDYDYTTPWKRGNMGQGVGSGFIIDGNRILTNAHNISNQKYIEVKKQNIARRWPARVSFVGHDCDLAIITIDDPAFFERTIPLQLGGLPKANTTVQTCGFPVGGRQVSVTEGVVSRVQVDTYSHTRADSHLVVQTDAAINPGNSGGPVMQDGKVVGVAFQGLQSAENIGYMIPTTVVRHFLKDIDDGQYDGFGSLGFSIYPGLHSKSYAEYLKVPASQDGIVVISTQINSSVENIFERGDVITKIDDFNIDNDGMIKIHGLTLHLSEAIEQKQLGEELTIIYYRDGIQKKTTATVALNQPVLPYWRQYDKQPRYIVFAGLTFVPVSRNFLETWGDNWIIDLPFYLRYLFSNSIQLNDNHDRKEYVVLAEILPDEVNSYAYSFENKVVKTVNGVEILSLEDIPDAVGKCQNSFCTIEFMGSSTPLILDNSMAEKRQITILEQYQVPAEANLNTF
jgi:S1-C subfamily serine protease